MKMKVLKYILIIFIIISASFVGVGVYISSQYGAIVEKIVVESINKNLISEVKVGFLEVSAFEDIPYLSLVFSNVAIMEPKEYQEQVDTLIFVKNLSLQFDLLDILDGNYQLRQVKISNGFGQFEVNKKGISNFIFWKSDTLDSEDSEFQFRLKNVELEGVKYSYIDKGKKVGVRTYAENAIVTGDFSSEKLKLLVKGAFDATSVNVGDVQYLSGRNLEINTGIQIDNNTNVITFLQGDVMFNNAFALETSGNINGSAYTFDIGSDKIRLEELNSLVPKKFSDYKKRYDGSGDVQLKVKIFGDYKTSSAPSINADFALKSVAIVERKSNTSIRNISFEGSYSNGLARNAKTSKLVFNELSGTFPSGRVAGNLEIRDFNQMLLISTVTGEVNLHDLVELYSSENLDFVNGRCDFNINLNLNLSRLSGEFVNLKESSLKGEILLSDIEAQFQDNFKVQNLNGKIKLDKKIANLVGVSGQFQNSKVELNGEVQNALHWIFIRDTLRSQPLRIMASVKVDRLDVEEFLVTDNSGSSDQPTLGIQFPFSELQLDLELASLIWDRFEATDLKSKLLLSNGRMVMNPVVFESMDGSFNGKVILNRQYDNSFKMKLISNNINTNVEKMFYSFYNFGQQEITSNNIQGTANINSIINGELTQKLELLPSTIEAKAQVKIVDGKLIDYRSLEAISDYFLSNLLLRSVFKADELEQSLKEVEFDNLENEILIKDEKVILPRMTIGTSVLKLNLDGTVDFNGVLDYHFDFDISDLLVKDKSKVGNDESISQNEGGGIRVFIHMYGPSENPTVEIDKERKKLFKRAKKNNEKNEFKSALKEEFGWFKSDTSLKNPIIIDEFDIEWEEEADTIITGVSQVDTVKLKKKNIKDVFKLKNEEETEEFDFGDDDF